MDVMSTLNSPAVVAGLFFAGSFALAQYWAQKPKTVTISEIWIYPIKSCKGIKVQSSLVVKTGFRYDRVFMLVDMKGMFLSQRKYPRMALIETKICDNGMLEVNAPGMPPLFIPLDSTETQTQVAVTIWDDICKATQVLGPAGNKWFCDFLGVEGAVLVRMQDGFKRSTDPDYAPKGEASFADGFPFLLVSEASLSGLNSKLAAPVKNDRFRPNIIVSGCDAFAEDKWTNLEVKCARSQTITKMASVKPCARCTIPNIDQATGVPSENREPSKSMKSFRSGSAIGITKQKWGGQLFYGVNVDHESQSGMTLSVGDEIRVIPGVNKFY